MESCLEPWRAGVGLREAHVKDILTTQPRVAWFEFTPENFIMPRPQALDELLQIAAHYPCSMHGIGMSLGGDQDLRAYLTRLAPLIRDVQPFLISDHLCWCNEGDAYLPDLLPLPYTEETIQHLVDRIQFVQDFLGRRLLVENLSNYLTYQHDEMPEWAFVAEVVRRADCDLLLDVNNIYVSSQNCGYEPSAYFKALPAERVREYHLAGYTDMGTYLLDTHSRPVQAPVWELYELALQCIGPRPTLIEWDNELPEFDVLQQEAERAEAMMVRYHHAAA